MALTESSVAVMLPISDADRAQKLYSDILAEIAALEGRGITFEDYDLLALKTQDHVAVMGAEKAAWFLDPDGNVLCLHQTG